MIEIRRAEVSETEALALLWRDGWRDGHEAIVPAALARLRTLKTPEGIFDLDVWRYEKRVL